MRILEAVYIIWRLEQRGVWERVEVLAWVPGGGLGRWSLIKMEAWKASVLRTLSPGHWGTSRRRCLAVSVKYWVGTWKKRYTGLY